MERKAFTVNLTLTVNAVSPKAAAEMVVLGSPFVLMNKEDILEVKEKESREITTMTMRDAVI